MMKYLFFLFFLLSNGITNALTATNEPDSCYSIKYDHRSDSLLKPGSTVFSPGQVYVPAALITAGVFSTTFFTSQIKYKIAAARDEVLTGFHTNVDDYLQFAPVPIAYCLDPLGVNSRDDLFNRSLILLKGEIFMLISVDALKYTTKERRPDGSNLNSFPSGHTAQAFAAATFLSEEYKDKYPWIPYVAYAMAGTTGLLRMANNRHFVGDVLAGAGIGILSMKLSYWTHKYRWGRKPRATAIIYKN